jgi:hypothetical protein
MLGSPFTTDAGDFVGNRYWAVSPFEIPPHGRFELRLSPLDHAARPGSRDEANRTNKAPIPRGRRLSPVHRMDGRGKPRALHHRR